MRYRVELDGLLAFVDKLEGFEQRAEAIANRVDGQVGDLHSSWDGQRSLGASHTAPRLDSRCHADARSIDALEDNSTSRPPQLHRGDRTQRGHADMTVDVDSDTFYAVGGRLFELAGEVYDAFAVNVGILGATGAMAGTDDAGTAWATSYDARAKEVLDTVNDLTLAMQNYGGIVIQAGYNHAVADYNATASQRGEPPQRPPEPASTAGVLATPPSAGGPGKGLFDNALGLVEQVGVPVPDGDTVKVDTAAQAWDRLATVYQTTTVVEALEVNARAFSDTHSPEVEFIVRDLHDLRDATSTILAGCRRTGAVLQGLPRGAG